MTELCQIFNIQINPQDIAETLGSVFKRVKSRISDLINLDDDSPVLNFLKLDKLNLSSPVQEVALDVSYRL